MTRRPDGALDTVSGTLRRPRAGGERFFPPSVSLYTAPARPVPLAAAVRRNGRPGMAGGGYRGGGRFPHRPLSGDFGPLAGCFLRRPAEKAASPEDFESV